MIIGFPPEILEEHFYTIFEASTLSLHSTIKHLIIIECS